MEGVMRALEHPACNNINWQGDKPDLSASEVPWEGHCIGGRQPVALMERVHALEEALGRKAEQILLRLKLGDVPDTCADITSLTHDLGCQPSLSAAIGVKNPSTGT